MPFYWRLSESAEPASGIAQRLPIRVVADAQFDYLKFEPSDDEWAVIDAAYHQNENIGFLNPQSGQLNTYGSSVNNFFLDVIRSAQPKRIVEIGCGAGFSIVFLRQHGFVVTGVDPSDYSQQWSERLGFQLIKGFFQKDFLEFQPDFVYCNDVFEHVPHVESFSKTVFECLGDGGVFCFATTNSSRSIAIGDISMLEHQHVNMFTERSIRLILNHAGFSQVTIRGGSYGNTFHVTAVKSQGKAEARGTDGLPACAGYFERAATRVAAFQRFYEARGALSCYVPLRCIPYLAAVGDFGLSRVFDSNAAWRGKYIDGYGSPIEGVEDVRYRTGDHFFVGSLTFFDEIKKTLVSRGFPESAISSIQSLP